MENEGDLVIVHSTDGYESYEELLKGVREVTGETPLVGTLTGGLITQDEVNEDLNKVAVMVLKSEKIKFTPIMTENTEDMKEAGKEVASELSENWPEDAKLLLTFPGGFLPNVNDLFEGLEENLPENIPFLGGSSGGTPDFKKTCQFFNDEVKDNAFVCVLFSGDFQYEKEVTHGGTPLEISGKVTKAEKNIVKEIDGEPAFKIYEDFADTHQDILYQTSICLGTKMGGDVILRIPLGIQEDGSLVMPTEWSEGTEVFLCHREYNRILKNTEEKAKKIRERIREKGKEPELVLQFECLGRAKDVLGLGKSREIAEVVQENLVENASWLGWYSYGEVAPVQGKNEFHNWTQVLLAIY